MMKIFIFHNKSKNERLDTGIREETETGETVNTTLRDLVDPYLKQGKI